MSAVRLHMLVHGVDHMRMRLAQILELYRMPRENPRDYFKLPLTVQLCPTVLVHQVRGRDHVSIHPSTKGQLVPPNGLGSFRNCEAFDHTGLAERVRINLPFSAPLGNDRRVLFETFAILSLISFSFSFAFVEARTSS